MQYEPRGNRRIYVASSWRNPHQPWVVEVLRNYGHQVYDFRDPSGAFRWSDVDHDWRNWSGVAYKAGLMHPEATRGYFRDFEAMEECDTCVMVLPCGASAHLELGWCKGQNKDCHILIPESGDLKEPELMYRLVGVDNIHFSFPGLLERIKS